MWAVARPGLAGESESLASKAGQKAKPGRCVSTPERGGPENRADTGVASPDGGPENTADQGGASPDGGP
eukprot:CAMPEP_0204316128 /NCGR_PEP_ID=MMETSP0469-20131031/5226_1 /ASSEMBLY_ACC=CAM_ASM_000384 /TAXON_ID=2969 /ORGANISM="Oxyrrhis marina" /LENGTH=68 /DNA_ID=CAMNT_0051296867 /DNA_START=309 /DNA_END=512 /DNA_ORIENTATION=+